MQEKQEAALGIRTHGGPDRPRIGAKHRSVFFSICIPQYNRTSFLIEALRTINGQTFRDFEVCIADDRSTDGRSHEIIEYLQESGLSFVYQQNAENLRYDGNLRAAIGLASGVYCLLMGNDDALAGPNVLARLRELLVQHPNVGLLVPNFADFGGARVTRRVRATGVSGRGVDIATSRFRNLSFVSGLVLRAALAKAHATDKWDGSEMYQMYLGSRIVAEGHELLELDEAVVLKDIIVKGESVDSYAHRPRLSSSAIIERRLPLVQLGRLVEDAIRPHAGRRAPVLAAKIFLQVLMFPYPFWIIEYRRVQSWRFAAGICLGMRPRALLAGVRFKPLHKAFLCGVYFFITCVGLLTPTAVFDYCKPLLYAISKSLFQRSAR
jgi:glycosyltransferase involved in cell wall biosynthesis